MLDMNQRVSVVMSVFNDAETLGASIDSIQSQTFKGWELIIIDDASIDATPTILKQYSRIDNRIHVYTNSKNQGLAASLNQGWKAAKSDLIARMDADDMSHPDRLAQQVAFLEIHREIDVLGTSALIRNKSGEILGCSHRPTEPDVLAANIMWENPFFHPSIMMRRSFLTKAGGYDETFYRSQDYELWSRCTSWARYANIDKPLITYTKSDKLSWKSVWFGAYARWRAAASLGCGVGRVWYPARFVLGAYFSFRGLSKIIRGKREYS